MSKNFFVCVLLDFLRFSTSKGIPDDIKFDFKFHNFLRYWKKIERKVFQIDFLIKRTDKNT